jgi:hypothetical protein
MSSQGSPKALIDDLGLLSTTVAYFASMQSELRLLVTVCSRLQQVAALFLRLAQLHVSSQGNGMATAQSSSRVMPSVPSTSSQVSKQAVAGNKHSSISNNQSLGVFDNLGLDIKPFLDWLPADILTSWPMLGHDPTGGPNTNIVGLTPMTIPIDPNIQDTKSPRGRKRPFDNVFDWFSWDAYYEGNDSGRQPC